MSVADRNRFAGRACRDHLLGAVPAVLVGIWLLSEALHASASQSSRVVRDRAWPETLLVLGCPARRDGRPSAMQRWRVELAARNLRPDSTLVFSGADEADLMAGLATSEYGIAADRITRENDARTTWENIGNSAALIPPGGIVRVVSDPLHARRGERYWRLQLPERAGELRPARLYRLGEHPLLKVGTAAYDVVRRGRRLRAAAGDWLRIAAAG